MIYAQECGEMLGITPKRVKQILKERLGEKSLMRIKENSKVKIPHSQVRMLLEGRGANYRSRSVVIGMEKGGVGKSILSCNIGIKKASLGARVLIIDLDPESCATNLLIREEDMDKDYTSILEILRDGLSFKDAIMPTRYEGLDIVPCKGKARRADRYTRDENLGRLYKDKMEGLSSQYDLILFEVPPTFSNTVAGAYLSSDLVVMPTFPDSWSLESILLTKEDIEDECEKWGIQVPEMHVILNKYRPDRSASKDAWAVLINDFKDMVLPFQIRESADLQNSINEGKSVFETRSSKMVKESIAMLADFVCPLYDPEKMVQ